MPGEPGGIPAKASPFDCGAFGQKLLHGLDRHMSVDDVATQEGGMTALKLGRDAGIAADRGEFFGLLDRHGEAVGAQIIRIAAAAFAARRLVEHHRHPRLLSAASSGLHPTTALSAISEPQASNFRRVITLHLLSRGSVNRLIMFLLHRTLTFP